MAAPNTFGELGLSIIGVASHYPPNDLEPKELEALIKKFYPETPA
jgi:type III polyketide synthase